MLITSKALRSKLRAIVESLKGDRHSKLQVRSISYFVVQASLEFADTTPANRRVFYVVSDTAVITVP